MPIDNNAQLFQMAEDAARATTPSGNLRFNQSAIETYLKEQGVNPGHARTATLNAYGAKVNDLIAKDLDQTKIRSFMLNSGDFEDGFVDEVFETIQGPRQPTPAQIGLQSTEQLGEEIRASISNRYTPEELTAMTKQIYSDEAIDLQDMASLVNSRFKTKALIEYKDTLAVQMQNTLRKVGLDVKKQGNRLVIDKNGDGNFEELTPGIIDELKASSINVTLATTGGIAGGILGGGVGGLGAKALFGKQIAVKIAKWTGGTSGAAAGGVLGGGVGAALDAAQNALVLQEELEVADYWRKMKSAGKAEAILGIVGNVAVDATVLLGKTLARTFDLIANGNTAGAYSNMKNVMGLDDDQVKAIIKEYESITGTKAQGLTLAQKGISVVPITQPGGEMLVSAAAKFNTIAGAQQLRDISTRSAQLSGAIGQISHNVNSPIIIKQLLDEHDKSVKSFYGFVKDQAKEASDISSYQFDYDKLTIEPLMQAIESKITNPAVLAQFELYTRRVRGLGGVEQVISQAEPTRTITRRFARGGPKETIVPGVPVKTTENNQLRGFSDLLDLRRTMNDFKFNKRISSVVDFKAIDTVLAKVDGEIARAASVVMTDGKKWLDAWKEANIRYTKMKRLENNALARIFRAKGANPQEIVKRMSNKVSAIDGTFMEVIHALPKDKQALAEGAVLDVLRTKYTVGNEGGFSAVHFPKLADELRHIAFSSKGAKDMKRAITAMGTVFKNDVNLYKVSGSIDVPTFQSYLTADPVIRMKYEVASTLFNKVRKFLPGENAKKIALVTNIAKLMQNPRSMKTIEAIKRDLPNDPEVDIGIRRLMVQQPAQGELGTYPAVTVFRVSTPGAKASQSWRFTDEKLANIAAKRSGGAVDKQLITPQLIATEEEIMKAAHWTDMPKVTIKELKGNHMLVERLRAQGFTGMTLQDVPGPRIGPDVLMFK